VPAGSLAPLAFHKAHLFVDLHGKQENKKARVKPVKNNYKAVKWRYCAVLWPLFFVKS